VHFYNGRGRAEQWMKEGKYALKWTRLSCHRFVANQVRLQLFTLAYNLGNFVRRLTRPKAVTEWSLRSVQLKLIKTGARPGMPGAWSFRWLRWQCPRTYGWQYWSALAACGWCQDDLAVLGKMGGCAGEQDWCVPQPIEDGDLARQEGVPSGERAETRVTLDPRPPQEIGSNAVRGAVGAMLRTDRCPCGVRAV
jgi:hypothetical protein